MITVFQIDIILIGLVPVCQHGLHGFRILAMVILIFILHMEITSGCTQLLLCHPLLTQAFIFFIAAAVFPIAFIFSIPALMVTLNPLRRRMAHTISLTVIVLPDVTMAGLTIGIRVDGVTDIAAFRLRRHTVYIYFSCGTIRLSLRISVCIYLRKINIFPDIESRSFQWLVGLSTILFKVYVIVALKCFRMAV